MSMTEILDEVSKLTADEREVLFQRLAELEAANLEETPEPLAAIDEARAEPSTTDVSAEEMRRDAVRWARTK